MKQYNLSTRIARTLKPCKISYIYLGRMAKDNNELREEIILRIVLPTAV